MPTRTIQPNGWTIHPDGRIQRHDVPSPYNQPSDTWKVTGAVTLNNFGHPVRYWTLQEILDDPGQIPWKHKNGKQKTHLMDIDHGTRRMRGSPDHSVT